MLYIDVQGFSYQCFTVFDNLQVQYQNKHVIAGCVLQIEEDFGDPKKSTFGSSFNSDCKQIQMEWQLNHDNIDR